MMIDACAVSRGLILSAITFLFIIKSLMHLVGSYNLRFCPYRHWSYPLVMIFFAHQMTPVRRNASNNGGQDDGQGDQNPPPNNAPLDPMQFMTMHTQLLQNLTQVVANLQQAQQQQPPPPRPPSGLREFLSTQPPTFSHAVEPLDADDWLTTIESKLRIAQCTEQEKVLFASHQLTGPAAEWWTAFSAAHASPNGITWREFVSNFRNRYVPAGEIKLKRKEFLSLKQGSMTVRQYLTRFTQLSR